jgi:hypothetical protein
MIRRIDARISSIEGSWTFAGCVISDSKSSTPSHALFYTRRDGKCRLRIRGPRDFIAPARLVPNSSAARILARFRPAAARGHPGVAPHAGHESLCCLCKGYVMAINDCKQRTRDAQMIRLSLRDDVRRNANCGDSKLR